MAKIIWRGDSLFRAPQQAWEPDQEIPEEEVLAIMPAVELETLLREQPGLERIEEEEAKEEVEASAPAPKPRGRPKK